MAAVAAVPDGAESRWPPRCSLQNILYLLILAAAVSALLHVRAFYGKHQEGDELVYLGLARTMTWDLSRYDTRDVPVVRDFPYSIYRQPLFHHGPLYPLIIKFGFVNGMPVETALLFGCLCVLLLMGCLIAMQRIAPVDILSLAGGLFFVAVEPFLLFTTTRLLHDGISGVLLAAGLLLYVLALESRSLGKALGAALLISAALNMRYNILVALPLIPLFQAYALYRQTRHAGTAAPGAQRDVKGVLLDLRHWTVFAVMAAVVGTVGMQHFYRILATYGTLSPDRFIIPAPGIEQLLPVVRIWNSQTRTQSLFHIFAIMPVIALPLLPPVLTAAWRGLREGRWIALLWGAYLYMALCWLVFSHNQLRYFATCTPLFALLLPWMLSLTVRQFPRTMGAVLAYTTVSCLSLGYFLAVLDSSTGLIVPSIYELVPAMRPLFMNSWGW